MLKEKSLSGPNSEKRAKLLKKTMALIAYIQLFELLNIYGNLKTSLVEICPQATTQHNSQLIWELNYMWNCFLWWTFNNLSKQFQ